jgi:hypothetical protein
LASRTRHEEREDEERGTRREARDVSEAGEWPRYDFNFWQDCVEWLVLNRLWRFVLLMVIGKMFMSGMHVYLVCVFLHGMHLFLGVSAIGIPLHAVALISLVCGSALLLDVDLHSGLRDCVFIESGLRSIRGL